ncbi:endo-1,4-beta-xylanase [Nocardia sp. NPDC052112]|uniref:endo-1,4-beta-xylanase n=1 Tax=Nocardia sp. NPDC052112 TaxID=3155646 RepID=UPI00343E86DC
MSNDAETPESVRERITDPDQELLRPIIRPWVTNGVIAPDAFNISQTDRKHDFNRMSIARSVATTPEQAYKDRANAIKERCEQNDKIYQAPAGVLAVTVEEVESVEVKSPQGSESRHPLTAWDDSMNDNRPDDHGHIDFNEIPPGDKGACLLAAKALLDRAKKRGWKYGPFAE